MPALVALLGVTAAFAAFGARALPVGFGLLILTAVLVLATLASHSPPAAAGARPDRRGRQEEGSVGGCTSAPVAGPAGNDEACDDGGGDGASSSGSGCGGGGCGGG